MNLFRKSRRFRNVRTKDAGRLERLYYFIGDKAAAARDRLFPPKGDGSLKAAKAPSWESPGKGRRILAILALLVVAGASLVFLLPVGGGEEEGSPSTEGAPVTQAGSPGEPLPQEGKPEAAGPMAEGSPPAAAEAPPAREEGFAPPASPTPAAEPPRLPVGIATYDAMEMESAYQEAVAIQQGGTISQALERLGVPPSQSNAALSILDRERILPVVRPGDVVKAYYSDPGKAEGSLLRLEFYQEGQPRPTVMIPGGPNGFIHYSATGRPLELYEASQGKVKTTFWNAGIDSGMDPRLIMSLADLLASQIDFVGDVRDGDNFQLLFRARYEDGVLAEEPQLEVIQFTSRDKTWEFYRQDLKGGQHDYFDAQFRSIKKDFLASPLQFRKISSGFSNARMHPIKKVVLPHHGVDYAAPIGTPVSAVADGVVSFAGSKGGYGTTVIIDHDSESQDLQTIYAHLSRIEKGVRQGTKVSQNELIGYVGSTGLSTGPHLDFRLRKKGGEFLDPEAELAKQQGKELPPELQVAFIQSATARKERLHDLLDWSTF